MKAFISYSHRDDWARERLHTHLEMLRREGQIEDWYDREILAGDDIDDEISEQLESCELFLPLVSPDFLASRYCYEREMTRALKRHDAGEVRVVPIIIEPCDWANSPLKRLKALPRNGKPVVVWTNQNTAFLDVVTELRRIVAGGTEGISDSSAMPSVEPVTATKVARPLHPHARRDSALSTVRYRPLFSKGRGSVHTNEVLWNAFRSGSEVVPDNFGATGTLSPPGWMDHR